MLPAKHAMPPTPHTTIATFLSELTRINGTKKQGLREAGVLARRVDEALPSALLRKDQCPAEQASGGADLGRLLNWSERTCRRHS